MRKIGSKQTVSMGRMSLGSAIFLGMLAIAGPAEAETAAGCYGPKLVKSTDGGANLYYQWCKYTGDYQIEYTLSDAKKDGRAPRLCVVPESPSSEDECNPEGRKLLHVSAGYPNSKTGERKYTSRAQAKKWFGSFYVCNGLNQWGHVKNCRRENVAW
ncbi:hypothetical protein [Actinomadura rudentiformis]|uniref:Uncharacterized protein n=1 Tax=Actinomadura rudentiformis TaxID=359158 RepID=A0A6H9YEM9_9ACTN|nr:hypothetical protein [Actinomadura rudentiformis]KAB2339797.1 hypothetical protein F8566_46870 [Actinomadura rudentiformis]